MTVRILLDPYGMVTDENVFRISTQTDYVQACRDIECSLKKGRDYSVVVQNRGMKGWFDHFIGQRDLIVEIFDPCQRLAAALGIGYSELPEELRQDPGTIVSESLVDKARSKPRQKDEPILSWVLRATLGAIWADMKLDRPAQLTELLTSLLNQGSRTINSTILALRNIRIKEWCKRGSKYTDVIGWLFGGIASERAISLALCRLLWKYPKTIRVKALQFDGRWSDLSLLDDLSDAMEAIPVEACTRVTVPFPVIQVVRQYLQDALVKEPLEAVASCLSGCLAEEEKIVRRYLEQHVGELDQTYIELLDVFEDIFARTDLFSDFVNYLRRLKPRPIPPKLEASSSWDQVSEWLDRWYFPFLDWCETTGQLGESASSVDEFEQWLLAHYEGVTKTDVFAPYAVRELLLEFAKSKAVLLLVIDSLPWTAAGVLQSLLAQKGLRFIEATPRITTLPTVTSVAKPSLVRGQLPGQIQSSDDLEQNYRGLLSAAIGISSEDVAYGNSKDTSLVNLIAERKKAYLYLVNEIDQHYIHTQMSGEQRRTRVNALLSQVAEELAAAISEFSMQHYEDLAVIVASDHGYTELPRDVKVLQICETKDCSLSHARLVQCASGVTPPCKDLAYIDYSFLGETGVSFWVCRGYDCLNARPKGAAHGGLTPQEVVVPTLRLHVSADLPAFTPVQVIISGKIRRQKRENTVAIEVFNPNTMVVKVVRIDLSLISISTKLPVTISPGTMISLEATADGSNLHQQQVAITGTATVVFCGESISADVSCILETTGAAVSDKTFEDEFDI